MKPGSYICKHPTHPLWIHTMCHFTHPPCLLWCPTQHPYFMSRNTPPSLNTWHMKSHQSSLDMWYFTQLLWIHNMWRPIQPPTPSGYTTFYTLRILHGSLPCEWTVHTALLASEDIMGDTPIKNCHNVSIFLFSFIGCNILSYYLYSSCFF